MKGGFVLARQSLGACRANDILRVHGHRLAQEGISLELFDTLSQNCLNRLLPGMTDLSHVQASLSVSKSVLGCRWASEVARSAQLGALVASKPLLTSLINDTARAGLCEASVMI